MKPLELAIFLIRARAIHSTTVINTLLAQGGGGDEQIAEDGRESALAFFTLVEEEFSALELTSTVASVRKLNSLFIEGGTQRELAKLQEEMTERLVDEAKLRQFFSLTLEETIYYQSPWNKWEPMVERFPRIIGDVEEASKCYALSRYTASVFHSTQIVEHGMIALGDFLRVKDHLPGFTATSREIKRIFEKPYPSRSRFEKRHSAFLEQVSGAIAPLQMAWRNKVSHADGKLNLLTTDFSAEVAEEILMATRGLMRRLAVDMPLRR